MDKRYHTMFIMLIGYLLAIGTMIHMWDESLVVGTVPTQPHVIIVDAGHGGFDGGAEAINGALEKDINLSIALNLRDLLTVYGFDVIMTRDTDVATCDEGLESVSERKTSDIINRLELIKQHPDAIFLSIHQNKYPEPSIFGAQMFYGTQSPQSQPLAEILQKNFCCMLQTENTRKIKPAEDNIYLLTHSPVPSVLIECGFVSNPLEADLLVTENYQSQIAFVIAGSLLEYIEQSAYPQAAQEVSDFFSASASWEDF